MGKFKVGQLVILTTSFLRVPVPCFAYIYKDYTFGKRKGYSLIALYTESQGNMRYHLLKDLDGFSGEEMERCTIPYIDDDFDINILSELEFLKVKERRDINTMSDDDRLLKILLFKYLTEERITSYIRDYTIDQII
tara:strand:- start:16264 stop:16671 length:408 start_codon:yes stop_codon:yes gene_type:complete